MKVQNIILLRRKYISYLFELADKTFTDITELNNSVDDFQVLATKDLELNKALQRLESLQADVLSNLEPLENMSKFNAKDMKENSLNKQHLTKKIKQIQKSIEDNYRDMNDLYQGIILHNASYMIQKLRLDDNFAKLQDAIQKTDKEFLDFCNNFKQEDIAIESHIFERSSEIIDNYKKILLSIDDYKIKKNELQNNRLNMAVKMKVKNLKNKIITLTQTVDSDHLSFKELYPESLKFRINEIKPLYNIFSNDSLEIMDTSEDDILHENSLVTDIKNINIDIETLDKLSLSIQKYLPYYQDPNTTSEKKLKILTEEKNKIIKAAISFDELTIKTATQWLEINQNSWFAITKKYISSHSLAPRLMNTQLNEQE